MTKRAVGMRVNHEKKSDGVRVYHERKTDEVRIHHQKEQWGKSSPKERAMGREFTMRKGAMG